MRRSNLLFALIVLALLAGFAAKGVLVQTPALRTQNAAGTFDAVRAKDRLANILGDQRPHPADTPADDAARARLVAQLQQLGLKPIVRDQFACNELYKDRGVSCARVRNVIAILGPPTGKALLLNAHYDSTPVGPGAADDGIGVATLLEVAADLKNQPLRRPIILLFNEGEELGLIGARAFLADPLSSNVDSLINLEARGVSGPVSMFETSRPNAAAIAIFSAAVKNPVANSLSTDVYRLLPNYTDVNSFSERGWLTLNLAPIGNETRYHSPGDDIAALDPSTIQHMGDQTLALTRALDNGAPEAGADRIFMDVAGTKLISMPLTAGLVLLVLLLVGFTLIVFRRGRGLTSGPVIICSILGSALLAWLGLTLAGSFKAGTFWRAEPIWTHLATYTSAIVAIAAVLAVFDRTIERRQLRPAFWLAMLALGALITLLAPGGIIFFIIPPFIALAGIIAARWWRHAEQIGTWIAIAFLWLTWGALVGLLEELLNGGPMWLFASLGCLLILPVLIEAKPLVSRAAVGIAAIVGLASWIAALSAPAYSTDRQQRFLVRQVTNAVDGKAYWSIVNDRAPLPSALASLGSWRWLPLPYLDSHSWVVPAPAEPGIKPPTIEPVSNVLRGRMRIATFKLHLNGAQSVGLIGTPDAQIASAGTSEFSRPIDRSAGGKYYFDCFGRSCDGAVLQFATTVRQRMGFTIIGSSPSMPASAQPLLAARPRHARPQYERDESLTVSRVWL